MKNVTQLLLAILCLCVPALLNAQERDDSRYLAGAVPEVNGKVVFTKEFAVAGMSQDEIFGRMSAWMDARLKKNENNSRVLLTDKAKGLIVGTGEEWMVFSSSALSLDRTKINYQLTASCEPERCILKVEKIRYVYREGKEKYVAEEWIVDKYALNKAKTKLVRGLAKWRRKTVDLIDAFGNEAASALSIVTAPAVKEAAVERQQPVVVTTPAVKKPVAVEPETPVAVVPEQTKATLPQPYKAVAPDQLPSDAIRTGTGKLVIVIGEEPFNVTMMTADSGGSLGKVDEKPVVFSILSPDQPHEAMDKAESYVVRFYPTGKTDPTLILECKPLPAPAAVEGMPRTYVGEILNALTR